MARLRALIWVAVLAFVTVSCGSPQDTKNDPPTKKDTTGNEGGRIPPGK